MAEVAGLLLGVTGPLQQLVELLHQLKTRCDAVGSHQSQVDQLLTKFLQVSSSLRALELTDTLRIPTHSRQQVVHNLREMREAIDAHVTALHKKLPRVDSKAYKFFRAGKTAEFLATLTADARHFTLLIAQTSSLLATVDISYRDRPPTPAQSHATRASADVFSPAFSAERNDRVVALDFHALRPGGAFATVEGRLKAMVLGAPASVGALAGDAGALALGVGGVGKTCALRALAQDADVRKRFADGVFFRSLGHDAGESDVVSMLAHFVCVSGGTATAARMQHASFDEAIDAAGAWFARRSCLFIVDDLWRHGGITHDLLRRLSVLADGPCSGEFGSRLVYSTRDKKFAEAAGGAVVEFKRRSAHGREARCMLLEAAGARAALLDDPMFKDHGEAILTVCDGLPFTLNIAGRLAHRLEAEWPPDLRHNGWRECAERLQNSASLLDKGGESFFMSLLVSIKYLDDAEKSGLGVYKHALESLCVFRRQDWVPLSVCQRLFCTTNDAAADAVVENLRDFGIVETERRMIGTGSIKGIRFHDHVHACAADLARKNKGEAAWYTKLVRSLYDSTGAHGDGVCWPALVPDDGYSVQNVCRLLMQCEEFQTVGKTLTSGQWVTKMMYTGDVLLYERDVDMFKTRLAETTSPVHHEALRRFERITRTLCKVVRMSQPDCAGQLSAAWFQLCGRLQYAATQQPWIQSVMAEADAFAPRPFLRPLAPCFQFPTDAQLEYYRSVHCVSDVRLLDDGRVAVCGYQTSEMHEDISVRVYSKDRVLTLFETRAPVVADDGLGRKALFLSPDATRLAAGHVDGVVRVWHMSADTSNAVLLKGHTKSVSCVCICADGTRALSASEDRTLRLWDVQAGTQCGPAMEEHDSFVKCVCVNAVGTRAVSGAVGRSLRVWDLQTGCQIGLLRDEHMGSCWSVCMNADGSRAVSGHGNGSLVVWDLRRSEMRQLGDPLKGHNGWVWSVDINAEGTHAVSASEDKSVRLWDLCSGLQVGDPLMGHSSWVWSVHVSADCARAVSASVDRTVRVWDFSRMSLVGDTTGGHEDEATSIAVCADGTRAVSGSRDGSMIVWDLRTDAVSGCRHLQGHTEWVLSLAISADGRRVVSGSNDEKVRVWDVESGLQFGPPLGSHPGWVRRVEISDDGRRAASLCDDNLLKLWDVDSGECVQSLNTHDEEAVTSAREAADRFITGAALDTSGTDDGISSVSSFLTWGCSGQKRRSLASFDSDVASYCVSRNGDVVGAALRSGTVALMRFVR